uniref:Uncharacterized protein n=1 Tax=Mus spicilegus TaxID=10103 RepID=A0A8C6GTS2_MUSSI
ISSLKYIAFIYFACVLHYDLTRRKRKESKKNLRSLMMTWALAFLSYPFKH